mgnify:FL=1
MAPPIVILTGAGISQESGIATFRDADGLWARHRIEDVATPVAFARNPVLVQRFYNARRAQLLDPAVQPNAAHLALARLEAAWPAPVLLVTHDLDEALLLADRLCILHQGRTLQHGAPCDVFC